MSTIYVAQYNNYYNRIIRGAEITDVTEIIAASGDNYAVYNAINFNPADGISTQWVCNYGAGAAITEGEDYDANTVNYLIVVEDGTTAIVSRWFIIESAFNRGKQVIFTLKRDCVADYFEDLRRAPVFIEKATLPDSDPFIFNHEDITFNQIKQKEIKLFDYTRCAWVVGYYDKNAPADNLQGTINYNNIDDTSAIAIGTNIEAWQWYPYVVGHTGSTKLPLYPTNYILATYVKPQYRYDSIINPQGAGATTFRDKVSTNSNIGLPPSLTLDQAARAELTRRTLQDFINDLTPGQKSSILNAMLNAESIANNNEVLQYAGKNIRALDGRVFKVQVIQSGSRKITGSVALNSALYYAINNVFYPGGAWAQDLSAAFIGTPNGDSYKYSFEVEQYEIQLEELPSEESSYDMSAADKITTTDAQYNIFALPLPATEFKTKLKYSTGAAVELTRQDVLNTAASIAKNLGTYLYDLQILPYCPIRNLTIEEDGNDTIINFTTLDDKYYSLYGTGNVSATAYEGIIFNVPLTSFSFKLQTFYGELIQSGAAAFTEDIKEILNPTESVKVQNECDLYRLCSPNFNTQFNFSAVKAGGLSYFDVDCTYQPSQPYIHIAPKFELLYGRDFNDARGLILGGDYSLPVLLDAWTTYKNANKNYQEIFNRQIENIEIQQRYGMLTSAISAFTGIGGGVTAGALSGAQIGGVGGAVVGGAVGAAASAAGGAADLFLQQRLNREAIDYSRDQFGYNLQNIIAQPDGISKVGILNDNNKLVPVLEYYSCTQQEKEALKQKLYYNGMKVGRIGTIDEFRGVTPSYIKGKIIRIDNFGQDFHTLNDIANELNLGVFI